MRLIIRTVFHFAVPIINESKLNLTATTVTTHKDTYKRFSRYHSEPALSHSAPLPKTLSDTASSSVLHAVKLSENQIVVRCLHTRVLCLRGIHTAVLHRRRR